MIMSERYFFNISNKKQRYLIIENIINNVLQS